MDSWAFHATVAYGPSGELATLPTRAGRTRAVLTARVFMGVACVALMTACQSVREGGRAQFSAEHSCPETRIGIRRSDDLPVDTAAIRHAFGLDPAPAPAELDGDAERIAVWRENTGHEIGPLPTFEVLELVGCGLHELKMCRHPSGRRYDDTFNQRVACVSYPMVEGVARP